MPKVLCTLKNVSDEVSGVKFSPHPDGGMVSEDVDAETAELFASVPGYELVREAPPAAPPPPAPPAAPVKGGKAKEPQAPAAPQPTAPAASQAPAVPAPAAPGDDETAF